MANGSENPDNPTGRFSDRVEDYVRYRPDYPTALSKTLASDYGIGRQTVVADIGSGTGISTSVFIELGCPTYAVEPNDEMRQAAEDRSGSNVFFHSIAGCAENSTLEGSSVDCVAAGQAFHWFDIGPTKREFRRILKPGGLVLLFWNVRLTDTSPFLAAYEQLLLDFSTDYQTVDHRNVGEETLRSFFERPFSTHAFSNEQRFDLTGLRGRLLSSSYAPKARHPNHTPMLNRLNQIFSEHASNGEVRFEYSTELHVGSIEK